jgi:hypothetical protein
MARPLELSASLKPTAALISYCTAKSGCATGISEARRQPRMQRRVRFSSRIRHALSKIIADT